MMAGVSYPIEPPVAPMLSRLRPDIPVGDGWLYEPKWDGFRAIVFRDGERVHVGSRNGQPLERYFPELVETFKRELPERCVVDGEIIISLDGRLEFEALQLRLHPAASRVRMLAERSPASFVAFDVLARGDEDVREHPFAERRAVLVESVTVTPQCFPTPQTPDADEARAWFERFEGAGLDGIVAKLADGPYREGERVMVKVKHERTADCVVGGYRLYKAGKGVGSLLLGLYDDTGMLRHVGFTSSFTAGERVRVAEMLAPLEGGTSFTGDWGPGGPSRWNKDKDLSWISLEPKLVCEVAFDHLQGERFRHGARLLRWRPDKDPRECTFDQLESPQAFSLDDVVKLARRSAR